MAPPIHTFSVCTVHGSVLARPGCVKFTMFTLMSTEEIENLAIAAVALYNSRVINGGPVTIFGKDVLTIDLTSMDPLENI